MSWIQRKLPYTVEWYQEHTDMTISYSPALFRLRLFRTGNMIGEAEVPTVVMANTAVVFFDHLPGSPDFRLKAAAALAETEARAARHNIGYAVQYYPKTNTYDVGLFTETGPEWAKNRTDVPAPLLRMVKAELAADYFRENTTLPHQQQERDDLIERIARAIEMNAQHPYAEAVGIIRSFKTGGIRS